MFYKAKIKKVENGRADIDPLLEDRNGAYATVEGVSILHIGGGDVNISHLYKADDVVLVALCGYPVKQEAAVNRDLFSTRNFDNSVIMGRLYAGEAEEGVAITYKDNAISMTDEGLTLKHGRNTIALTEAGKFAVNLDGKSLFAVLINLIEQISANQTLTQLGPQMIQPNSMVKMNEIKNELKQVME